MISAYCSVEAPSTLRNLSTLSGTISVVLGLTVLFGWYSHNAALIQISPTFVGMQYNTALGFFLCGAGLLSARFGHRYLTLTCGLVVALIGGLTLIEYGFALDLGIDQLFMEHYVTAKTSHPGRMAANTALCFTLAGIALAVGEGAKGNGRTLMITGTLGSLVFGLGGVALSGYAVGLETAYGWGNLSQMAVHTSAGFMVHGAGMMVLAWGRDPAAGKRPPSWVAMPVGIAVLTVTVALWQATTSAERGEMTTPELAQVAEAVTHNLILLFGIILAAALALTVRLALAAGERASLAETANRELAGEILIREQAEKALRESEERFRSFSSHSPNKIHIKDTDGRYLIINPQSEKLFGVTNAQARGKTSDEILPREMAETFGAHERAVLETGRVIELEERFSVDGVERTYLTIKFPIRDAAGDIAAVGTSGTDITERKVIEEELRKARDHLELRVEERTLELSTEIAERRKVEAELLERTNLLQLLYSLTTIVNEAGDVDQAMMACLRQICDYTGWPVGHTFNISQSHPDRLTPSNIWHMSDPQRFSDFREITERTEFLKGMGLPGRVLESEQPEWIEDLTENPEFTRWQAGKDIGLKTGFAFPIKVRNKVVAVMEFFSPMAQEADLALLTSIEHAGTQIGRLLERAEAEKGLRASREEADLANRAKSQFLSSMSHELRTPLNAVMGFSQLMQNRPDEPLSSRQKAYTDHIIDAGAILLALINEILDLASIEADQLHLSMEDAYAGDIIAESIALVLPTAKAHNIPITNRTADQPPALIHVDALRLTQVLLNLLSNSVKYNKPGGAVKLDARETDDGYLHISVTDTGIGISPEHHADVFEPFQRLGVETARSVEGTGIGLTVTRQLVERMDGRIGFESEEGNGSTFWIEMPLASKPAKLLWNEKFGIGIKQIDDDHKVLITLLDRASVHGLGEEDVDGIISELIDYTLYHFRREEAIMEACGYPNLEEHRAAHRKLAIKAERFAEEWRKARAPDAIQELLVFLRTWLVNHIMKEDAEIRAFARGQEAEIRQALERISNPEYSVLHEPFELQVPHR